MIQGIKFRIARGNMVTAAPVIARVVFGCAFAELNKLTQRWHLYAKHEGIETHNCTTHDDLAQLSQVLQTFDHYVRHGVQLDFLPLPIKFKTVN